MTDETNEIAEILADPETNEIAEILADPDRDTDILDSDPLDGDQGDSAESAPPATSASATSASPHPVNETEVSTDNADSTDAQPAKVRALASESAAPALPPSLTEEKGFSSPHSQQPADVSHHFDSQVLAARRIGVLAARCHGPPRRDAQGAHAWS